MTSGSSCTAVSACRTEPESPTGFGGPSGTHGTVTLVRAGGVEREALIQLDRDVVAGIPGLGFKKRSSEGQSVLAGKGCRVPGAGGAFFCKWFDFVLR